ncbi:hypothetical protein Hanom_Chr02g00154471 [Helianthus anomalus]
MNSHWPKCRCLPSVGERLCMKSHWCKSRCSPSGDARVILVPPDLRTCLSVQYPLIIRNYQLN